MRADERPFDAQDKRSVCREIAADTERDAATFDGKPFTGRTVAEYFGNQGAAIAALALIVEEMLPRFYRLPEDFPKPEGEPGCNCGGNPQDFEGPLPACPVHGKEQPAEGRNDFGRDDPNAKPPGEHEPCDLCAHPLVDHLLVEGSGPRYYDRPCDRASCDCENFKRWTGAQSGTTAPPPQSLGTGLGFSPTEPKLTRMDELETTHPENLAAMMMKIGELEEAIRYHLYVCPLPSANLRKAIGYKPGVALVRPCSLPFASIEDAGGPDPSPFDSDWNGKCQCGHLHGEHGPSSSINFTAGACQWSEARTDTLSEKCSCKHFIHEGTASAAP